jgi:transposase-like protein
MIQTKPLTGQCPRCGATAEHLAYHSRYLLRGEQMVFVIRCRQCRRTFCDRYGTAFYDLKTPEERVQRAIRQGLEGLCPEAVARVEGFHPTTVQRWVDRACLQAKVADQEVITGVSTENVELAQTQLFKSYYNLCRKRGSLRGKTPAQAAGLADHRWTLRELLTFNAAITSKIA